MIRAVQIQTKRHSVNVASPIRHVAAVKRRGPHSQASNRTAEVFSLAMTDETILREISALAVPHLADVCRIELADQEPRLIVMGGTEHARSLLTQSLHACAERAAGHSLEEQVWTSGQPMLVASGRLLRTPAGRTPTGGRSKGPAGGCPLMLVPLVGRLRVLGVLVLASVRSRRPFKMTDLSRAMTLASRGVVALETTRFCRQVNMAADALGADLSRRSHDLKNVLMSLNLTIEMLTRASPPTERRRGWDQLERLRRSIQKVSQMVDDLARQHASPTAAPSSRSATRS